MFNTISILIIGYKLYNIKSTIYKVRNKSNLVTGSKTYSLSMLGFDSVQPCN